ncbi:NitT/TauT family transport system permease protein [Lentibacillus persicus]|uniref:NitT/TauT family transport system permease protein n=1 Tax=Lentibacillus persicus TaxID=640948 RepID=A0A1I1WE36_9BACI|nr:ABC transporter permease [Lentibacillus persicus]SFD93436.1 NitT/TauT family transport system permease protein [Lentibacillus persicus]
MIHETDDQLHANYKQNLKREKQFVFSWQIVILISFFGIWELASRMYWVDPLIFSSPSEVGTVIISKFSDGSMLMHTQVTLFETVLGFLIGTFLGIMMATALWSSERFSNIMDPYLVIMNAMPKVALGPIIIVAMGPGYFSIITMGAIIAVVITTLVVYSAFREVDSNYVKVLKSFKATRSQIFKEAIFPAAIPAMISTLKVNVGLSWVGVVVGEFLVSNEGLGYLIVYGFQVFDFSLVMSSLILIAIFAALMYKVVERIEVFLMKRVG